jgi:hypothetical protein
MFALEAHGDYPVYYKPAIGNPSPLKFDELKPDFLRDLPKNKSVKYWIDHSGTVWGSGVDAPTDVNYSNGTFSWKEVSEAGKYKIYTSKESTPSKASKATFEFLQAVDTNSISLPDLSEGMEYYVSAIDIEGFETPAVSGDYSGYADSIMPIPDTPVVPLVSGMSGYQMPQGTTVITNSVYMYQDASYAMDGDPNTAWVGSTYSGYVIFNFPKEELIKGIQISGYSTPPDTRTYVFLGLKDDVWTEIGRTSQMVTPPSNNIGAILQPTTVIEGHYKAIRVELQNNSSWVALGEVTILR